MNAYTNVRVGDVCKLVNGRAFKPEDWSLTGQPIIRIQNLNDSAKPFNYWAGSLHSQVMVQESDVLLAWSGTPGTSFGAHIWKGPAGILNQHIFRVDLDESRITKQWWVSSVNSKLDRLIEQAHGGVGLKHVTRGMVESLEIPLPSLLEQHRITKILCSAEELCRKRQVSRKLLNSIPHALFSTMFGDPASNPLRFESALLGDIVDFIGGSQPPKSTFLYEPGPDRIRFIQIRDFRTDEYKTYVPAHLAKRPFTESDVMIGRYGPPVFQIFRGLRGTYNVALMKAAPKTDVLNDFVFYLLQETKLHSYVVANSERTAGQSGVNLSLLENYPAYKPPLDLQMKFSECVKAIEAQDERVKLQESNLHELLDSLHHRAFAGKLTARQAERELEMAG